MNKNRNLYTVSLLFTFLSISLISAQNLIKITNSLPVYALNSEAKIIEIVAKNVNSRQQDNGIQASGHFANNQIQNGSVTWIQGGLWDLVVRNDTNMTNQISKNTSAPTPSLIFLW